MTAESTLKLAAVVERYERVPTVEFWDNHKRPFEQVPVCPQLNELYFTNAFVFKERFCSIFLLHIPCLQKKKNPESKSYKIFKDEYISDQDKTI